MPAAVVDGNDVHAVHEVGREAVERARAGGGPTLLECRTYRHYGHSKADPAKYRPKAEVERRIEEQIDSAVASAKAAPYPDPRDERATEFAP